jgi:hypothetical protein
VQARTVLQLVEEQLRVARHHGHQIIDVVRDPACETADRFHLQGLPKLHFRTTERFRSPGIDVGIGHHSVAGSSGRHLLGASRRKSKADSQVFPAGRTADSPAKHAFS